MAYNVVIATLNSKYIHSSLAPWCLLAGIKKYCKQKINSMVIEGTINENVQNVAQRIISQKPDLLGVSCYIWNIELSKKLIDYVKNELPQTVVVVGGPEVSYNPQQVMENHKNIDYVISGEGELPFAQLVDFLANNQQPIHINGLCSRAKNKIIISPPNVPSQQPPSPYTDEYFNSLHDRIAYLETSRGCPYSCAFCLSGRCGNVRYFDLEQAKKEIIFLANSGTQTVKLVDRTFNANKKRAYEIFDFIIKNYGKKIPEDVCFHFEIAGDILDEQTIQLLNTAPNGAVQLEIGLQSFNEKTLAYINRKTKVDILISNIKKLIKPNNIHIHIDLIAGLPYEDFASFKQSFNIAYFLKPNMLQLGFLKILYGSQMGEDREKFPSNYSKIPPYEIIDTPWLSTYDISLLHLIEDALERIYNSGRFKRTIDYVLKCSEFAPFDLLFYVSNEIAKAKSDVKNISLDEYSNIIFEIFSGIKGVLKEKLRDTMVCDRLSTNASGTLPKSLKIKDSRLKQVSIFLKNNIETSPLPNTKRGLAILYSENKVVYVDYEKKDKHPVTGEYPLKFISIKDIL